MRNPSPRPQSIRRRWSLPLIASAAAAVGSLGLAGCGGKTTAPAKLAVTPRYEVYPPRDVPAWMDGTILQQVNLEFTEPYRVSNYGLVALTQPTGDATSAPNNVREYLIREMTKRDFGSVNQPGFEKLTPERVLRDKRMAIVRVDAFIPPGAYKDQRIDAQVSALPDSNTTSLAGGSLYTTDLSPTGADTRSPGDGVNVMANARGYVFVNPAYVLNPDTDDTTQRRGLTQGLLLNGARVNQPRPIGLRVRSAERRLSRMIERRIDQQYADDNVAAAQDEGRVFIYMPAKYRGDWEHFTGVVTHTFFNADSAFAAVKARQIAAELVKPDALLLDLSYAIESLGEPALPEVESLLTSSDPAVAYAVARAAAWIGDGAAEAALVRTARDPANAFRINAVQALSALPTTPAINVALRELLAAEDATVRIEAYKGLVRNQDLSVVTMRVGDKYMVDLVDAPGAPLVYASRSGMPRIALIGPGARVRQPTFFTAMNDELSIADSAERTDLLTIFYRGTAGDAVKQVSTPDLAELIRRLGGEGPPGQPMLNFTYCDVVALLGKLADTRMLVATQDRRTPANFVLQAAPGSDRGVNEAPVIPEMPGPRPIDGARPAGDAPAIDASRAPDPSRPSADTARPLNVPAPPTVASPQVSTQ